ncbi:hypothetical protein L7F22_057866 [Adiantum nelumboides]|nr:hypothetical protein [Adiantum nelumboides]
MEDEQEQIQDNDDDEKIEGTSGQDPSFDDDDQDDPPSGPRLSSEGATKQPTNPPDSQSQPPPQAPRGGSQGNQVIDCGRKQGAFGQELALRLGNVFTIGQGSKTLVTLPNGKGIFNSSKEDLAWESNEIPIDSRIEKGAGVGSCVCWRCDKVSAGHLSCMPDIGKGPRGASYEGRLDPTGKHSCVGRGGFLSVVEPSTRTDLRNDTPARLVATQKVQVRLITSPNSTGKVDDIKWVKAKFVFKVKSTALEEDNRPVSPCGLVPFKVDGYLEQELDQHFSENPTQYARARDCWWKR